jgi:hypothetical protein
VQRASVTALAGLMLAATLALAASKASAATPNPIPDAPIPGKTGLLSQCSSLRNQAQYRCYIRGFLTMIDRAGDPASELPRIDAEVHQTGGFLEAACHPLMHTVGRTWAREHHVTFANLMRYTPRSNDPGCSAGFGMGLVMYLGPQLVLDPRRVLGTCSRLATRFRRYTCIHGAGHALMRGFHSQLRDAVRACRALGPLNAPDCAQGAFHDYWIALSGADGTTPLEGADGSARSVCAGYEFARPCWYRFFWERHPDERMYEAKDILHACNGLDGIQRAGCVSGASLSMARTREPVDHARTCGALSGSDTIDCLRGVNVPLVAGNPFESLRLIRTCADLPRTTRSRCYGWFGRTLAVVTDGRFRRTGCTELGDPRARNWCAAGAEKMERPLRTFS